MRHAETNSRTNLQPPLHREALHIHWMSSTSADTATQGSAPKYTRLLDALIVSRITVHLLTLLPDGAGAAGLDWTLAGVTVGRPLEIPYALVRAVGCAGPWDGPRGAKFNGSSGIPCGTSPFHLAARRDDRSAEIRASHSTRRAASG